MNRLICLLALFLCVGTLSAQQNGNSPQVQQNNHNTQQAAGNTPAAQLAHHIADKMSDTLGLSSQQRAKIFGINMDLFQEKKKAREKSQDRSVVGASLQAVEATRDSRYKLVLSEAQYARYLAKKTVLISSK